MRYLVKRNFILFFAIISIVSQPVFAQGMKKVLVLDFINIEKNPNVHYLEASLTDAVREKLKKLFAYQATPKKQWQEVAQRNFIFREDYATKSAAMNLGLLARQDVVISGGFRIEGKKNMQIITRVRIIDIAQKKFIADFEEKGPADNRIFDTVDRIAAKIVEKSRSVLPTKEQWQQSGLSATISEPIFDQVLLNFHVGGGLYALDYSDKIEAKQPAISAEISVNMPFIWKNLSLGLQASYIQDTFRDGASDAIDGLSIVTSNYLLGGYLGFRFEPGHFFISPRMGGGMVLQAITVTGLRNENATNSMPYASAGFVFGYSLNNSLDIILSLVSALQLDQGNQTLLSTGGLGIQFRL